MLACFHRRGLLLGSYYDDLSQLLLDDNLEDFSSLKKQLIKKKTDCTRERTISMNEKKKKKDPKFHNHSSHSVHNHLLASVHNPLITSVQNQINQST